MTDAEREKLIDAMCLAYRLGVGPLRVAMGRALAVAEPVVREDERKACIRTMKRRWKGGYPGEVIADLEAAIRASAVEVE